MGEGGLVIKPKEPWTELCEPGIRNSAVLKGTKITFNPHSTLSKGVHRLLTRQQQSTTNAGIISWKDGCCDALYAFSCILSLLNDVGRL